MSDLGYYQEDDVVDSSDPDNQYYVDSRRFNFRKWINKVLCSARKIKEVLEENE